MGDCTCLTGAADERRSQANEGEKINFVESQTVTSSTKESCSVRSLSSAAEQLGESGPGGSRASQHGSGPWRPLDASFHGRHDVGGRPSVPLPLSP